MMLPKLKKYDKKFDHTYTFGAYPTIDLLRLKHEQVVEVVINPEGEKSDGVSSVVQLCREKNIPINYSKSVIEKIAFKENTYVVGVFKKYSLKLQKDKNHVVLVNPSNAGNLGTIIRTMIGFEISNLAIITPAVDIFDPKVLRSTMGAFFSLNFEFFTSIEDYQKDYKNNLFSFMLGGSEELSQVKFTEPYSLVFGNEGSGLDSKYSKLAKPVYIKHSDAIDSLNLSVCVGIVLHEVYKR